MPTWIGSPCHGEQEGVDIVGAIGGMIVPAAIFVIINWGNQAALSGWAIPAATDIAFALGILALLGSRVPTSLKLFLMTIAIFDDLGAIAIIAIFYSADLSTTALVIAVLMVLLLVALNLMGVTRTAAYMLVGLVLWVAVLKSGVHATLALSGGMNTAGKTDTGPIVQPESSSFRLFLRHFEPLTPPDPVDTPNTDPPAFSIEKRCDPRVTVATILLCQVDDCLGEVFLIRSRCWLPTLC